MNCELILHVPPAFKRLKEGYLIRILQITADRNAVGDPGALDIHGLEQTRDIGSGCLTLHIRIGGENDFIYFFGPEAREKLPDVNIIRAYSLHGRKSPMKHMVQAMVLVHTFQRRYIPRIPDHTDLTVMTCRIRTDRAGITGGVIAAGFAESNSLTAFPKRNRERTDILLRL